MTKEQASGLVTASMLWTLVVVVLSQNWISSFGRFVDEHVHGKSILDQPATTLQPAGPPQVGPIPDPNIPPGEGPFKNPDGSIPA
jgi:hypothetical protein